MAIYSPLAIQVTPKFWGLTYWNREVWPDSGGTGRNPEPAQKSLPSLRKEGETRKDTGVRAACHCQTQ